MQNKSHLLREKVEGRLVEQNVHAAVAAVEFESEAHGAALQIEVAWPEFSLRCQQAAVALATQTITRGHHALSLGGTLAGGLHCRRNGCGAMVGIELTGNAVGHIVVARQAGAFGEMQVGRFGSPIVIAVGGTFGSVERLDGVATQSGECRSGNEQIACTVVEVAQRVDGVAGSR